MRYLVLFLSLLISPALSAQEAEPPVGVPEADKVSVVASQNDLAYDLYNQLHEVRGNFFFSPESIAEALSMTFAGARDQTANDMQTVLHYRMNNEHSHAAMAALLKEKNARATKDGYDFSVANAIWVQKEFELLPEFLSIVKDQYGAHAENLAFDNNPAAASAVINDWVEQKTDHKIKNLVNSDAVAGVRLVLTDAVYFKADWKTAFKKGATVPSEFHVDPAQSVTAKMMHRNCTDCKYSQNENYQALALPYKGDDIELVVLLPRPTNGIADFEESLNLQTLHEALESLAPEPDVEVYLPRFHVESQFNLKGALSALGMKSAFDASHADFSGMTGKRDLFISDVIHKAFVDVDENGTEAAAATAVMMAPTAMRLAGPKPEFRADHPFIFAIRDMHTKAVYFMGRITNPAQ